MSRTIIAAPALLAALWCFSAPANAQTQSDLVKECLAALNTGDSTRANQIAEDIKTWRNLLSTQLIVDGLECLKGASGEQWSYDPTFLLFNIQRELDAERLEAERRQEKQNELLARKCTLKDEISQFELIIGEAERLSQQRQNETAKQIERVQAEAQVETVRICTEWYEEDKRGAVTDLVCNKIFLTIGLPDTELSLLVDATQSGPAADDLYAATSGLAYARLDLSIIELHGILPEEHRAQEIEEREKFAQRPSKDECAKFR